MDIAKDENGVGIPKNISFLTDPSKLSLAITNGEMDPAQRNMNIEAGSLSQELIKSLCKDFKKSY